MAENLADMPAILGYVLKGFPRISETFIANEILQLEELGFTLRLFSMRQPREDFSHPMVKKIKAQITYLPSELLVDFPRLLLPNILLAAKRPGPYLRALRSAALGVSKDNPLATLKHLLQAGYLTNRVLLREKISHLHGHFAHSPTSVTMFAAELSGIPFSFTAHAKDIYTSKAEKLRRKIDRAAFVVTCTRHNRDYLENIAPTSATPLHCLYHGIDLELFRRPERQPASHHPARILTIARLTAKKGLPTVYRALALLHAAGLHFQHTLVGDGEEREEILALIDSLGLSGHCRWLGTLSHDQVIELFVESDLCVLGCEIAASGDRDGIPNVLVESLAMGVPAVAPAVSAIPEILLDGETGLTVPPGNPQALSQAMAQLLADTGLRRRLIDGGVKHVRENFNNRSLTRRLADIFVAHNPALLPQIRGEVMEESDGR